MRVVMIGAARQGAALSRYLAEKGADVILNDQRSDESLNDIRESLSDLNLTWITGSHPVDILDGADLVCLSGGVPVQLPLVQEAIKRNISLSNDSQIFLEAVPCPVIGITGSAGKTTTTSLVGEIAKHHYNLRKPDASVWVGGNIGTPLITDLDRMHEDDIVVMELSSFQLEIMSASPQIATILNLTPNHLDRHGSMSEYVSAKTNILVNQTTEDVAVLNRDDQNVRELYPEVNGRKITFGMNPPHDKQDSTYLKRRKIYLQANGQTANIITTDFINLRGEHNFITFWQRPPFQQPPSFQSRRFMRGSSVSREFPIGLNLLVPMEGQIGITTRSQQRQKGLSQRLNLSVSRSFF